MTSEAFYTMLLKIESTVSIIFLLTIGSFYLILRKIQNECRSEVEAIKSEEIKIEEENETLRNESRTLEKEVIKQRCEKVDYMVHNYDINPNLLRLAKIEDNHRDKYNITSEREMKKRKNLLTHGCMLEKFLQTEKFLNYRLVH